LCGEWVLGRIGAEDSRAGLPLEERPAWEDVIEWEDLEARRGKLLELHSGVRCEAPVMSRKMAPPVASVAGGRK